MGMLGKKFADLEFESNPYWRTMINFINQFYYWRIGNMHANLSLEI